MITESYWLCHPLEVKVSGIQQSNNLSGGGRGGGVHKHIIYLFLLKRTCGYDFGAMIVGVSSLKYFEILGSGWSNLGLVKPRQYLFKQKKIAHREINILSCISNSWSIIKICGAS